MRDKGLALMPGQTVEYIMTGPTGTCLTDRVRAVPFLDGHEQYDAERYVELVHRGAAELLSPFGWSYEGLRKRDSVHRSSSVVHVLDGALGPPDHPDYPSDDPQDGTKDISASEEEGDQGYDDHTRSICDMRSRVSDHPVCK